MALKEKKKNLKKKVELLTQVVDLQKQLNAKKAQEAEIDSLARQGYTEGSNVPGKGILKPDGTFETPASQKLVSGSSDEEAARKAAMEGGARGEEFAPAFEADMKEDGTTWKDVDKQGGVAGRLDYKAGQSTGGGGNSEKAMKEAKDRAMKLQQKQQISGNTTYAFNPETLTRTQRAVDKFNFALDEAEKNPFEPKQYKDEAKNNLLEITSKELGRLFTDPNEIYQAYQTNAQFKATLDKFIKKGGTIEGVAKNVAASTVDNDITNGMVDRGELPESSREIYPQGSQSPADYLSQLTNPKANQEAQRMALEELSPETDIAQEEIMRNSGIPEELKRLYFGDEKTVGLLEMRRQQSVEEIRLLEEKEKDEKRTLRDKAQLNIEKNKAEARQAEVKIEQNRLAAKNYMTARLAQLGALQTTGAAVLALQTLETTYQGRIDTLKTNLKFANRELEIGLTEDIDKVEYDTDDKILNIQEDLTKDSETIAKEVMKAQQDADKEIYRITEQYGRRLRERTSSFTDDLKKEAEAYAKKYASEASGGIDFTALGTVKSKSKIVNEIENKLEASRGDGKIDRYVNSEVYYQAYKDWIARGGTAKSFVAQFPPKLYANPNDPTLPENLRYARESQTLPKDDSEDDVLAQIEAWDNED